MNSSDRKILIFPRPWFAPLLGAIVVLASSAPALTLAATGETKVGVTAASNINATGKPPISPARDLETGLEVFFNEKVTTNASGRAQLLFRDGTSLTIGAGSEMVIDKFVFDPASGTGEMAINITKGVFRLVGGKISKKTPVRFNTPTATVAVRGAVVDLAVQANGATAAYLVFGDVLKVTSLATGMSSKTTQAGFFIDNSLKVKKRDRADISKHLSKLERVPNAFSTGGDTDGSGIEHRLSGVAATTSELSGAATSAELAVAANRAASYGSTALGELVDAGLGTHGASGNRPSSNRGSDSSGDGTNSASGSSDSDRSDSVTGESSNDTQESTGDSSDSDTSDPVTDESSSGTQESTDENSGNNTSGSASARTGSTSESTGDPSASSTSDSGSGGSTVRISGGTSGGSASASASGGEEIDCDPRKDKDCKKMALAARAKATGIATMVQASGDRLEFTTTVSSAGAKLKPLASGKHLCRDCRFLEWRRTLVRPAGGDMDSASIQYWLSGVAATSAELAAAANKTASYSGGLIGGVIKAGSIIEKSGQFDARVRFGLSQYKVQAFNATFDGRNYRGSSGLTPNNALFQVNATSHDRALAARGYFFGTASTAGGVPPEMGGNFKVTGSGYSAGGIFAGKAN